MNPAELQRHWAELLEKLIWEEPADRLEALATTWPAQVTDCGLRLREVLAELSDESLALAIQKGFLWKEAFEELFVRRYTPYLTRWFYRWRLDVEQARDLMQQLFVKFLTNRLASFQPSRSFRAYLWYAARNMRVDVLRRTRSRRSLTALAEQPASMASPEEEVVAVELAERVETILSSLPATQQQVLRAALQGKTAEETAAVLGLSKQSVFLHLFRGRRRLEQELGLPARKRFRE